MEKRKSFVVKEKIDERVLPQKKREVWSWLLSKTFSVCVCIFRRQQCPVGKTSIVYTQKVSWLTLISSLHSLHHHGRNIDTTDRGFSHDHRCNHDIVEFICCLATCTAQNVECGHFLCGVLSSVGIHWYGSWTTRYKQCLFISRDYVKHLYPFFCFMDNDDYIPSLFQSEI